MFKLLFQQAFDSIAGNTVVPYRFLKKFLIGRGLIKLKHKLQLNSILMKPLLTIHNLLCTKLFIMTQTLRRHTIDLFHLVSYTQFII